MRSLLLLLLLGVSASAAAQGAGASVDTALANRIAGCYELAPGPWETDTMIRQIRRSRTAPITFELRRDQRVISDSMATYTQGIFSYWAPVPDGADRIRIGQPYYFATFGLRVSPAGRDLTGDFVVYLPAATDVAPSRRTPVTARRVNCSSIHGRLGAR